MAVTRGPIPKREDERRRTNKSEVDTTKVTMTGPVEIPAAERGWHPLAREWYDSLASSGQKKYMEPSDWAAARFLAHEMTRHLTRTRPSSQWFAAVWSAMNDLLTTEGARRRVRMEIERKPEKPEGEPAKVARLDDYRNL